MFGVTRRVAAQANMSNLWQLEDSEFGVGSHTMGVWLCGLQFRVSDFGGLRGLGVSKFQGFRF